ncbi:MAG: hypothetical protein IPM71_06565 [Bacteroidota bacterium]|nr:MAG: hypothetical protein IPM71_06565 [Bacteroidota bacterium]
MRNSIFATLFLCFAFSSVFSQRDAMLQGFYWDVPVDVESKNGFWYDSLAARIPQLKQAGFTEIWLPPPSKGNWGILDMGYGLHDHYDLGNYDQVNTIETRFGSFNELQNLIRLAHDSLNGPPIHLVADIILNHIYSTQQKDFAPDPAVKHYVMHAAEHRLMKHQPFPLNEIVWFIPVASEDIELEISSLQTDYSKHWDGSFFMAVHSSLPEVLNYHSDSVLLYTGQEIVPGYTYSFGPDVDSNLLVKLRTPTPGGLYLILSPRNYLLELKAYQWTEQTRFITLKPFSGPKSSDIDFEVLTTTAINFAEKTDLPQLSWNSSHFHPSMPDGYLRTGMDDYRVSPNMKWFGHDLNHNNPEVLDRLSDWGRWLRDSIGYDGYRFDFVLGVEPLFLADWINRVWESSNQEATMVAEYFTNNKQRIFEWLLLIDSLSQSGTRLKVFDFPLKYELTQLCNDTTGSFDMRKLLTAGLLFDPIYKLPANRLVSFADNHDTGKESDKWLVNHWHMAYAYILFAPPQPCVFYNHYFGDTQIEYSQERKEQTIPLGLKEEIDRMLRIRKHCLGGDMVHVSDTSPVFKQVYLAYRKGNGSCAGAFLSLCNTESKPAQCTIQLDNNYTAFYGKRLINAISPGETVRVNKRGKVSFEFQPYSAGVWMLEEEWNRLEDLIRCE